MPFLFVFWRSLSDLAVYRVIITTPILHSILFFLKWYGLVMMGVTLASGFVGYQVAQAVQAQLPRDQMLVFKNNALTLQDQPFNMTHALPLNFSFEANQSAFVIKKSNETLSSVPYSAIARADTFELSTNDIHNNIVSVLAVACATSSAMIVIMIMISRAVSVLFYAFLFHYLLQLIGGRFPFVRVIQILLHTTIVAETIHTITSVLYRNSNVPIFEIALLGSTLLVLQSLRQPSAQSAQ